MQVPVVPVQPWQQMAGSLLRTLVWARIVPLPQGYLDEPLRLAVYPGAVGPCLAVYPSEPAAKSPEGARPAGCAIVGQCIPELDSRRPVVADRIDQCFTGAGGRFIRADGAKGDPAAVVYIDTDVFPPAGQQARHWGILPAHAPDDYE